MERVGGEAPGNGEPGSRQSSAGASRGSQGSQGHAQPQPFPRRAVTSLAGIPAASSPTAPARTEARARRQTRGRLRFRPSTSPALRTSVPTDPLPSTSALPAPPPSPPERRTVARGGSGTPVARHAAALLRPPKNRYFPPPVHRLRIRCRFRHEVYFSHRRQGLCAWTLTAGAGRPPIRRMPSRAAARPGAR